MFIIAAVSVLPLYLWFQIVFQDKTLYISQVIVGRAQGLTTETDTWLTNLMTSWQLSILWHTEPFEAAALIH